MGSVLPRLSPPFALLCCATLILLPVASATLSDLPAATATLPRLPAATATLARFAVADVPRCRVAWPLAAPTRVSRWAVLCLLTPPAADRFSACSRDMAKRSWPEPCTIFPIATDDRLSPPDDDSPPPGAVLSLFCPMDCMSSSLPGAGLPTFNELARARDARAAARQLPTRKADAMWTSACRGRSRQSRSTAHTLRADPAPHHLGSVSRAARTSPSEC